MARLLVPAEQSRKRRRVNGNGQPRRKVLIYGDFMPTGFGRICRAMGAHLNNLYDVVGACVQYDGILPLQPAPMPFHVCALNGRDMGQGPAGLAMVIANVVGAFRPDVLISVQDFPYHEALHAAPIDWSVMAHIVITPVDGEPIAENWLDLVPKLDGFMTISAFGVEAFKKRGVTAELCPPGVDAAEFNRLDDPTRAALREQMSIPRDAFIVGAMAMNQGRKDFPSMVRGFAEAFRDVPNTYLYLDCEAASPAGWDMPRTLIKWNNLEPERVKFRGDAFNAGLNTLNERFNLLDLHMVLAHREGYGLPHGEAMATGCPTMAIDYCSGREIIGDNERGWLIPAAPAHPGGFGTWGGARDYWPDMKALEAALREAYEKPHERSARGMRGMEWVKTARTWGRTNEAVQDLVERVIVKRKDDLARKYQMPVPPMPPMQQIIPAGVNGGQPLAFHVNAPIQVYANNPQDVAQGIAAAVGKQAERVPLVESKGDET